MARSEIEEDAGREIVLWITWRRWADGSWVAWVRDESGRPARLVRNERELRQMLKLACQHPSGGEQANRGGGEE
jgi:hypothetical protein